MDTVHSLRELQIEMGCAIAAPQMNLTPYVLISDHFSSRERLNVYRNNFALSHHEALAAVYPVIKRLVGDAFFGMLAAAYLRYDPCASANMHAYGVVLADFMEDFPPVNSLPYLPDIARLEWAYHEVFHAETNSDGYPALDASAITDDGVLIPHPSLRWLDSPYPVIDIWQQNHGEQNEPEEIDLGRGGDRLLIYHTGLDVEIACLGTIEYSLVTALAQGMSISEAFSAFADQIDITTTLAFCLSHSIFIRFQSEVINDDCDL